MTTDIDATTPTSGSRLALIGSTVLTLTALAGFVGWNLRPEPHATAPAPRTAAPAEIDHADAASVPAPTEPALRAAAIKQPPSVLVILVGSETEAAEVEANAPEWNGNRQVNGLFPVEVVTVVVMSDADAEEVRRGAAEANQINAAEGLPPMVVADWRQTSPPAPPLRGKGCLPPGCPPCPDVAAHRRWAAEKRSA